MANPFDQFDQGPPAPVAAAPAAPAPAAAPAKNPFDQFDAAPAAAAAPAPAVPTEAPNETVNRLQSKVDDGTASQAERDQWLDARTADIHQASRAGRIARTIANAPYSKILPEIGGWLKNTASDAIDTGEKIAPAVVAPTPENLATAGKTIWSAAIGATAEGGSIGKGLLGIIGNIGISLNPFSYDSDVGPRIQAQSELQLSDMLRNVDPKAVKDLAPDQKAANTGAAAVDVASTLAGGPEAAPAKAAMEPAQVALVGVDAIKAAKQAKALESAAAAAQKVADAAQPGGYKAAAQYMAQAIKHIPVAGKVATAAVDIAKAAGSGAKAVASTVADAAKSPLAQRTAGGAALGAIAGGVGASPGNTEEGFASGLGTGALAGAARDPRVLGLVNGVQEAPTGSGLTMKPNPEQPPILAQPAPAKAPLAMSKNVAVPEAEGPPPPNPAGVDDANAAQPAKAPLKLGQPTGSTQPVSRFAGGPEAVVGILDAAEQGNARLRAEVLTGDSKVTPELIKDQEPLADKPLATIGPVPKGQQGDPAALKVSQDLGAEMLKQPEFDAFVNNLFGGNRGGSGTPTTQIRIHDMPDGTTFTSAGVKAQIIRPEGVEGSTMIRTDNPNWGDIVIHKPIEGKYAFPTDTGPQEIARIDKDNPTPLMIGGEPHQVLASRGKTDPVTLADAAGKKKVLASRTLLNADAPTVEAAKAPVPMTSVANSSNIESYGYDAKTQTLYVKPKGTNDIYAHPGVSIEAAKEMDAAASKGKFYNKLKKDFPAE